MQWMGESSLLLDRYDVRHLIEDSSKYAIPNLLLCFDLNGRLLFDGCDPSTSLEILEEGITSEQLDTLRSTLCHNNGTLTFYDERFGDFHKAQALEEERRQATCDELCMI